MSWLSSAFRSTEKAAVKSESAVAKDVKPASFVAPKAPGAPRTVEPTKPALKEPVEVDPVKPKTESVAPAQVEPKKSGSSVGTAVGVVGAGAGLSFLLPSFLGGGGGGGGGGGVLGSLLGTAGSVGSTAIAANAVTDLGGQAISAVSDTLNSITSDPLKLGIVAAVIVGVVVLSSRK